MSRRRVIFKAKQIAFSWLQVLLSGGGFTRTRGNNSSARDGGDSSNLPLETEVESGGSYVLLRVLHEVEVGGIRARSFFGNCDVSRLPTGNDRMERDS